MNPSYEINTSCVNYQPVCNNVNTCMDSESANCLCQKEYMRLAILLSLVMISLQQLKSVCSTYYY